ncbi:MAG: lipopolysaccharide biosynthesis protein [Jatrophihabitans sp.]
MGAVAPARAVAPVNAALRSGVARLLSFVPTAVATLLTSRVIIAHFGIQSFDGFQVMLALLYLLPLSSLGVGAAVTSAYAADGPAADGSRRVTLTASRVLALSTIVTATVSLLLATFGAWPSILGAASGPNLYCGIAVAVYSLSFVPGLGTNMLLGVHRNHVTVVIQTLITPTILLGVAAVIALRFDGDAVLIVPPAALVVNNLITARFAGRATGVSWRWLMSSLPYRRRIAGGSIRALAGPFLIISLATPIAINSDRIILSHVASAQAVADFSVLFQLIAPAIALVAATAQPLWPIYTGAWSQGRSGPSLTKVLALFCGGAVLFGTVLIFLANPLGHVIGGAKIEIGFFLAATGALAVLTAAISYPVGMTLMDPVGVRVVCAVTLVAVPINFGLSVWLAERVGAPGPLLATCIVGIGIQSLPGLIYRQARRPTGRHRRVLAADAARRHQAPPFEAVAFEAPPFEAVAAEPDFGLGTNEDVR